QGSPDEKLRTRGELTSYLCMMPGHLRFLGIPLVAGRDFAPTDDQSRPFTLIVNEAFARRAWPGEDAVGKQVKLFGSEMLVDVIGVVRNSAFHSLSGEPVPLAFFAYKQIYHQGAVFHVRTSGDPAALLQTIEKELRTLDAGVTFFGVRTMDDMFDRVLWGPRTGARLMSVFGGLGLLLAGLGVYAIMAHAVTQRTREIGIRLAIGAQARDVVDLIIRRGLVVSLFGLSIGLALAIVVTRHFQNFIPHVSYGDPLTFALVAVTLLLSALAACLLPALRATRINPLTALRSE
ncbi:MAG TPA: FtsX-like permease family protein, partial [Opitutaceae bacterium]